MSRILRSFGLSLVLLAVPMSASAHEKWFVDDELYPMDPTLIVSWRTAGALGAALVVLGIVWLVQRRIGNPHWPQLPIFTRMSYSARTLLAVETAITLIFAAYHSCVLSPHIYLPTREVVLLLSAVQLAIAFSFLAGLLDRMGAMALLAISAVLLLLHPFDALGGAFYAGIAILLLVTSRSAASQQQRTASLTDPALGQTALAVLRVLTGISILTLGLTDKVWNPGLGLAFLGQYPSFNFLAGIGLAWADNSTFILLMGIAEAAIGVLLISGCLTRLVVLGMLVPFNLTLVLLPPIELIGHLPLFGVMYVLLVHGPGKFMPTGWTTEAFLPSPRHAWNQISGMHGRPFPLAHLVIGGAGSFAGSAAVVPERLDGRRPPEIGAQMEAGGPCGTDRVVHPARPELVASRHVILSTWNLTSLGLWARLPSPDSVPFVRLPAQEDRAPRARTQPRGAEEAIGIPDHSRHRATGPGHHRAPAGAPGERVRPAADPRLPDRP